MLYPEDMKYVWVIEENLMAEVVHTGAHYSTVRYSLGGIDYEVDLLNDEFLVLFDESPIYTDPLFDYIGEDEDE